jgi:alkylhydroperoxidase family enzyme
LRPVSFNRVLQSGPEGIADWADFVHELHELTPRSLCELMILRTAQQFPACQEWRDQLRAALESTDARADELARWRFSRVFTPAERAALALVDDVAAGRTDELTRQAIKANFTPAEEAELVLIATFYCYSMVPKGCALPGLNVSKAF